MSKGIRLIADGSNATGDLFTRISRDLFFAIGYDEIRVDVHKTGREIDLQGEHRTEARSVRAECKAHSVKIGGADLNKFLGVLTRERIKFPGRRVEGYFLSLAGFSESAIEQERESGSDGLILLNGEDVVEQLVASRVVVPFEVAVGKSSQCLGKDSNILEMSGGELIAHQLGYFWVVFYSKFKERTHYSLIHADGTPIASSIALQVTSDDMKEGDSSLAGMIHLAPPGNHIDGEALAAAENVYRNWVSHEYGYIQLDGLPADTELSATRLRLERLFVPLRAHYLPLDPSEDLNATESKMDSVESLSLGAMLGQSNRLALLAIPGGGKSTFLKRLATAYSSPERRSEIDDGLPLGDWMPVFLRCRELKDRVHWSLQEIIGAIPSYAGMNDKEAAAFRVDIHERLRSGRVLLLVDGLDEISSESDRRIFAEHLRTFMSMFPRIAAVTTSREAGFRIVAGAVASVFKPARIAPLSSDDVVALCEKWHTEVVADTEAVRSESRNVAMAILTNNGIRPLGENPLLLTTLLVVKRSVGELPRSRSSLYREAIRVLVRTWNVEGYAPLDEEEALAQLSYVALEMFKSGLQQIGHRDLMDLLKDARLELADELQFSKVSPSDFLERIEHRSSLILQSGHARIDGLTQPVYEFRHLTFQEYLSARGLVEEQFKGRDNAAPLADLLGPYYDNERWSEVISLSSAISGRKAGGLVSRLIESCELDAARGKFPSIQLSTITSCLKEDIQISGGVLEKALDLIIDNAERSGSDLVQTLIAGKFGHLVRASVKKKFWGRSRNYSQVCSVYSEMVLNDEPRSARLDDLGFIELILGEVNCALAERQAALLVLMMNAAYRIRNSSEFIKSDGQAIMSASAEVAVGCLDSDVPQVQFCAAWALSWIGQCLRTAPDCLEDALYKLSRRWGERIGEPDSRFFAWAVSSLPAVEKVELRLEPNLVNRFLEEAAVSKAGTYHDHVEMGALTLAWYARGLVSDSEIAERLLLFPDYQRRRSSAATLLRYLGIEDSAVKKPRRKVQRRI
ncbi:NACHT domain-containing protein [Luteimonas sp. RC10]|uniref:NACHT domain-containing protein n=1 Tax=Luteimonas sp. RC10 TaxID=2587035 RepID=UPI0016124D9F|nr:NACHT domain-containing protein [Luteimonas sp. RC10]MBB3344760.1 hypothetical protein [Luteimonas sp. RC10]